MDAQKCLLKPLSLSSLKSALSLPHSFSLYHRSLTGRESIGAVAHDLSTAPKYVEVKNLIAAPALSLWESIRDELKMRAPPVLLIV